MRKIKKILALALSAAMVMGMSLTSMAAEPEVSVDAPIYAYDITNVVVPTNFVVAFNPNGLDVSKNGSTVTDQLVSKNYGIINKSTKDKVITVTLNVEDLNEDKINFVSTAAEVTNADADDYAINLTVIPADGTEVQVGTTPASADLTTTGADLANATMTGAASSAKVLAAGENDVDFLLAKAAYTGSIDLDNATDNNVADNFTLNALATGGKGITAFTFGGTMNAKADWTKLTKGVRITATYSNMNAPDGATAVTGTGALFENPNPVFKTGSEVGTIRYKAGTGAGAVTAINKVEVTINGDTFDLYNAFSNLWADATDQNGLIALDPACIGVIAGAGISDDIIETTVAYQTSSGEKTATVNVKLKESVPASFLAGSAVGTINYTVGTGAAALSSITKIEMELNGDTYDAYHAYQSVWADAVDQDGLITLDSNFMAVPIGSYPDDATRAATITYVTSGGQTKTATVNVKLR